MLNLYLQATKGGTMNGKAEPREDTEEELYDDSCPAGYGDHYYETENEEDPSDEWIFTCRYCGAETWN